MDKLEKVIATISGVIGFIVSTLIGGIGLAPTVLIGVMGIDFATGLMAAAVTDVKLKSRVAMHGFIRKLYVLLLLTALYWAEEILFGSQNIGAGVAIAYIAVEVISIGENGVKMGAPMPGFVKNILAVAQDKTKGESSEK